MNLALSESREVLNIFVEHDVDGPKIVEAEDPPFRLIATAGPETSEKYKGSWDEDS